MKDSFYTIAFMLAIAVLFTGMVSGMYVFTKERVELNRDAARRRVVLGVLGIDVPAKASAREVSRLYQERVRETDVEIGTGEATTPVLEGVSADGTDRVGYAVELQGRGLWDQIRAYVAVTADLSEIKGFAVYEQNETPGLGSEVTRDWFSKQFDGLRLPDEGEPGEPIVRLQPAGAEQGPHDVDAVTGATATSNAVEAMLNEGLSAFLAAMKQRDSAGRKGD